MRKPMIVGLALVALIGAGAGMWWYRHNQNIVIEDDSPPAAPALLAMSSREVEAATEALIEGRPTPLYDFQLRRYRFRDCERAALRLFLTLPMPSSELPPGETRPKRSAVAECLRWIETGTHPEMLPRLQELSGNPSDSVRAKAGWHLAAFGSSEVAETTAALLEKDNSLVVSWTFRGVRSAITQQRATDDFRARLYPVALKLCESEKPPFLYPDYLESHLLWLGRERGADFLRQRIAGGTRLVANAVEGFIQAQQPLDPAMLLKIIEGYRAQLEEKEGHWRVRTYGAALKSLAQQKHPRAKSLIDAILAEPPSDAERGVRRHDNERLRRVEAAAKALCLLDGFDLEKVGPKLGHREDFFFRRDLTAVERDLNSLLDAEVGNGGFGQYFGNSSGERWKEDLAMLKRIDAPQLRSILKRAVSSFGWSGPALDRTAREEQLDRFSEAADKKLSDATESWYESTESYEAKQLLYALKNRALLEGLPDPFPHPHPDVPY